MHLMTFIHACLERMLIMRVQGVFYHSNFLTRPCCRTYPPATRADDQTG